MLQKAISGCVWVKLDLAGTKGCRSDLTVNRMMARIPRGHWESWVLTLGPTLQSSFELSSPVFRFSVSDATPHPVSLGNNPRFHDFASLYSVAQPFHAAFLHPICQQSPTDFISKSLLNPHRPIHPQCSTAATSPTLMTLITTALLCMA